MGFNFLHSAIIPLTLFATFSVNNALILPALESDDYLLPPYHLTPDEKFAACCRERQIRDDLVEAACKYPPDWLSIPQQLELGKVLQDYVSCYAAHKSNRGCCLRRGCRGFFAVCQDFCDGVHPPHYSVKYAICGTKKEAISACNKAAWGPNHLLLDEKSGFKKSHKAPMMKHKQQKQLLVFTAEEEDQPQPQEKPEFVPLFSTEGL